MAACRRVYGSRHLQADCQEPGSAPEPYARQSRMGYLYVLPTVIAGRCRASISSWPRQRPLTTDAVSWSRRRCGGERRPPAWRGTRSRRAHGRPAGGQELSIGPFCETRSNPNQPMGQPNHRQLCHGPAALTGGKIARPTVRSCPSVHFV